jgi:four helix bundle protein
MPDFRTSPAWKFSQATALKVWHLTRTIPSEYNDLVDDLRAAAATVPAKLANACGRGERWTVVPPLRIALGASTRLQYSLRLAADLGVLQPDDYESLEARADEARRMIRGLIKRARPTYGRRVFMRPGDGRAANCSNHGCH